MGAGQLLYDMVASIWRRSDYEIDLQPGTAIWVCMGPPCAEVGAWDTLRQVRRLARRHYRGVRVREATCLGLCGAGPAIKLMPDRVRYWDVQPSRAAAPLATHLRLNPGCQPPGSILRASVGEG